MPFADPFDKGKQVDPSKETRATLDALIKLYEKEYDQLIKSNKVYEERLKKGGLSSTKAKEYSDKIIENEKSIKKLDHAVVELTEHERKHHAAVERVTAVYKANADAIRTQFESFKKNVNFIKDGVTAYHTYNLAVQNTIDQTGKFLGQSARGRQEFESFRHSLNLTRQEAEKFSDIFASGLKMGATNNNLKQMVRNLQDVHGQTRGLELAQKILATPMARTTFQRITRPGGDIGAAVEARRSARTPEEITAIMSTLRRPENRPPETREAVRFQQQQAKATAALDDIKGGIQALTAQGFSPELAAMTTLVTGIGDDVAQIAQNTGPLGQLLMKGFGQFGGFLGKISGFGGTGGGAGGGIGLSLTKMSFAKGVGSLALGEVGKAGLDWVAGEQDKAGHTTRAKWARVGGNAARGAGIGGMVGSVVPGVGTGVGVGVGGVIGGGVGIAQEFGDTILDYAGKFGLKITEIGESVGKKLFGRAEEKVDIGAILEAQSKTALEIRDALANIGPSIESMPESVRAGLAVRGAEIGVGTVSGGGVGEAVKAFGEQFEALLGRLNDNITVQKRVAEEARTKGLAALGPEAVGPKATQEQKDAVKAINDTYKDSINDIMKTTQEEFKKADVGKGARVAIERVDIRGGQLAEERQAAAERLRRTGAISGDVREILKNEMVINKTYAEESKVLKDSRDKMEESYAARQGELINIIADVKTSDEVRRTTEQELDNLDKLRGIDRRRLNIKEESLKASEMEAKVENKRLQVTAYELTATYRRSQAQQNIAKAQEEFAKERGGTPQEIGGFASQAAAGSRQMLDQFNATFKQSIDSLTDQARAARGPGGEGEAKAVQYEQMIYDLKQKGVELTRSEYQMRINAATAAAQRKQEELGVQKNILETVRDQAARTGQSWRVQMGYQSRIIQASRLELEAAREAFTAAARAGETGLPLEQKRLVVVQKESALAEAILGKQRDFLEKAVAASFGMGGGTKALPNINPRIFGEVIKDVLGQQWQGTPKMMEQTRQAQGGNLRGGIGVGGGINAAPGRPGVNPAAGGAPALPGVGPQASGGPGAARGGGVDVSGNFTVAINFDNEMFKSQVTQIAAKAFDNKNKQGAVG